ncbi:MAG: acyltransferase [Anaerolineales bacterium]
MIPGLDGLRAIAFLLVFALHTDYIQFGWVGVQLFFVLSGFLITGILLDMKKGLKPKEYFIKFYGRRFLRIFPLYYFYLALMSGVAAWLIAVKYRVNFMSTFLDQAGYALVYVYNFFFASAGYRETKFLDHFWSLSVEEQFYVFWPMLILLVPEKYLKKLFLAGIFLAPLFRLLVLIVYRLDVPFLRDGAAYVIYPLPFSHIDAFAFGAYISRFSIPRARLQFYALPVLIPIMGFTSYYLATGDWGYLTALGFPVAMPRAYQYIWGYSLLNYWFAIIIYCIVREKMLVRFLELPVLRYLGKISYGLYVYHFPIIWFARRIRDIWTMEESVAMPLTAIISLIATILVASLSYFLMEKPILNLKERYFSRAPSGVSSQAQEPAVIG